MAVENTDWVPRAAQALMDQVRPWLPADIGVAFDGARLTLTADPPGWATFDFTAFASADEEVAERVATAVLALLDFVQDFRARHTAEPWPLDSSGRMLLANSRARGGVVTGWFGDDPGGEAGLTVRVDVPR